MERKPKSFGGVLWFSFLDIKGPVLWMIAFVLATLFRIFPLNQEVSLNWIIPAALFTVVLLFTVLKAGYDLFIQSKNALPMVLSVKEVQIPGETPTYLCLLDASELFSYGIMVSFYYDDSNFEVLIGLGIVQHIREDKKIQIKIMGTEAGYEDVMARFKKNEGETVKKIIVKPHIPQEYARLYDTNQLVALQQ